MLGVNIQEIRLGEVRRNSVMRTDGALLTLLHI
jgi:hypothetical protein